MIRIAIAGIGNCASSLVQGVCFCKSPTDTLGLITPEVGPYSIRDIAVVAAFDIDVRKVWKDLSTAIFSPPNNASRLVSHIEPTGVIVKMAPVLDGLANHLTDYDESRRIVASCSQSEDVVKELSDSKADYLICYLPVGSNRAARFFAECALKAGCGFINCVPVFIANDASLARSFFERGLQLIGDDIRSQVGATIIHQRLCELLQERGYVTTRTYQLNVGGNADFLNMLDRQRTSYKKISKTAAVKRFLPQGIREEMVHIGPSDYVPSLEDQEIAYIRVSGSGFCGVPLDIDVKLEVQDFPEQRGCCR